MTPEGWKLVPIEPTRRMLDAGESAASFGIGKCADDEAMPRVWGEMIAAAPQPASCQVSLPEGVEMGEFKPCVIHYEEGDFSQMLMEDCPTITGWPHVLVEPLYRMNIADGAREIVGFQWQGKLPHPPEVAKIKPLEWVMKRLDRFSTGGSMGITADTPLGVYTVRSLMIGSPAVEKWFVKFKDDYGGQGNPYPDEETALVAAQANYEALVRSVFTVAPRTTKTDHDRIESAIRKLRILKNDFKMKGANATTIERAIDLMNSIDRADPSKAES